jgi:hypothetical protein
VVETSTLTAISACPNMPQPMAGQARLLLWQGGGFRLRRDGGAP